MAARPSAALPPSSSPTASGQPQDLTDDPRYSPQRSLSPPAQHRRGYQACDPCRKRKVKCDLGSVDNPRPPPCVRCRRESKRCEFSATRRKRKMADDADDKNHAAVLRRDKRMMAADGSASSSPVLDTVNKPSPNPNGVTSHPRAGLPSYEPDGGSPSITSQRKWSGSAGAPNRISIPPSTISYPAPTSVPSADQFPNHRPSFSGSGRPNIAPHVLESGQHMMNKTAAELLSPAISNTHDALHLLSEAAGRTEDLNRQQLEYQYGAGQSSSSNFTSSVSPGQTGTPGKISRSNSSTQQGASMGWFNNQGKESATADAVVDGTDTVVSPPKATPDIDYLRARRVWSRLRFIRAGWFSVDEAMAYIAYYYEHLAPLSPIVLQNFSPPSAHVTLLTEEPVLTVAMLTIASRHMKLAGNGANSRAYSIHEKLWSYLRGMIERLFWGQEKFGDSGGISMPRQFEISNPMVSGQQRNGQLRSIGTVEALLLLTDWHPRALHFPPGDDENTLLDVDPQYLSHLDGDRDHDHLPDLFPGKCTGTPGDSRPSFYKWLEPVWRSDRMSWMLLSAAQALAFELGIFDQKNELRESTESPSQKTRRRRLRRLILVYVSQSSGRLGIPSMLPLPQWNINTDPLKAEALHSSQSPEENMIDLMQDCWMDISKIMYTSNQVLFLSKEQTTSLIKTGQYRERIDEFIPSLREFKQKFDKLSVSPQMRNILTLEYEYTRLYVNCLALQAVVDRWTTMNESHHSGNGGSNAAAAPGAGTAPLQVLLEQYEVNEPYIQEVVDAARKILQTVLDGLVPGDSLKHAPVRTFFRILSGMIFILKTFTLGATEDEVRISLELQDRTIECLRTCIVDDVHLSVTIADLLQLLTENIRTRFLRFAPFDRVGECASRDRSPFPISRPHSPRPHEQHQQATDQNDFRWQQTHPNTNHAAQGSNGFHFDPHHPATSAPTTNDPLASIPVQAINSTNMNVSFMPPPPSMYYNYYDPATTSPKMEIDTSSPVATQSINHNTTPGGGPPSNSGTMSDWFALPLDQFFNSSTSGVDQGLGGTGPMVGEFDMLEVLLKEQYTNDNPTTTSGGGGLPTHFL
ncbi:hypothetical protein FQN57_001266 [Myotisia sp. PD_48]|nr:hypothetical protein FQN57_001266 [Myotisia sp. PD_48]